MKNKFKYLSYILDSDTPTYGNRNKFLIEKKSNISNGDVANDSTISTTVHMGTHIDMPYHFFEDGQTIEDFSIEYFTSSNVLYIDFKPEDLIINKDLIKILEKIKNKESYEFLVVKTGICDRRKNTDFWKSNYGFAPEVAIYLKEKFPNIRIIGFDSISVSSFENRMIGREAHKAFLNPEKPILLLEDMDLTNLNESTKINQLIIAPLRIAKCDGLPCTVIAKVE